VGVHAEVVGQLELGLRLPGHAEKIVDRLVANRQLAPLLEAQCLVERDRPFGIGDPVAGVDELHAAESTRAPPRAGGHGSASRTGGPHEACSVTAWTPAPT